MYAYMKKNERKVRICRFMMIFFISLGFAFVVFFIGGSHLRTRQVQATDAQVAVTCYKSVYVQAGDTLWSIADEYMDDSYDDKNEYIEEVKQINHITEADLRAGSYIIIPYTTLR
ncbi:MAG: LysM peptidoglycan-binding domain-containing protein [Clostridiales bacterium]|nr:LysM peptidoglycan-binding domain-containing protein [Clostridiales bacterium]